MEKVGAREFQAVWRRLKEPTEVYNRDTLVGTWIPAESTPQTHSWLLPEEKREIEERISAQNAQKARDQLLNAAFGAKTAQKGKKGPKRA